MLNSLPQQDIIERQSPRPFPPRRDYSSLSMRDLLDAREAYHVYLSTLENVVATAIGRYLIHRDDWYAARAPSEPRPASYPRVTEPRTLQTRWCVRGHGRQCSSL